MCNKTCVYLVLANCNAISAPSKSNANVAKCAIMAVIMAYCTNPLRCNAGITKGTTKLPIMAKIMAVLSSAATLARLECAKCTTNANIVLHTMYAMAHVKNIPAQAKWNKVAPVTSNFSLNVMGCGTLRALYSKSGTTPTPVSANPAINKPTPEMNAVLLETCKN